MLSDILANFFQIAVLELILVVFGEELVKEFKCAVQSKENTIFLKLYAIKLEKHQQIKPFEVDPHPKTTIHPSQLADGHKLQFFFEDQGVKGSIEVLKKLQYQPASFIPLA